jgi:hypothetical protein
MASCWRFIVVMLVACTAACATPTLAPLETAERWHYRGEQRLPELRQLEGVLTIARGSGLGGAAAVGTTRFEGTLEWQRIDAAGRVERVAGLARGRRDGSAIEFEVAVDGALLRHVARLEGGRHVGTWVDDGALGGALVSGAFTLERVP